MIGHRFRWSPALLLALAGAPAAFPDIEIPSGPYPDVLALNDLNGANGFALQGIAVWDGAGSALASAGDVNGDGLDDLIVGAPGADPNGLASAGEAYVVFGTDVAPPQLFPDVKLATLDGTNGFVLRGLAAGDGLGLSVSSAGDLNHDGVDDVIVGAPGTSFPVYSYGAAYVVFGRDTASDGDFPPVVDLAALDGTDGFTIPGVVTEGRTGHAVSSAAEVNGDGIDDAMIGAPGAVDSVFDIYDPGTTYVIYGRDTAATGDFPASFDVTTLDGTNGITLRGGPSDGNTGFTLSPAGDLNGDGLEDIAIGGPRALPLRRGSAYVVFARDAATVGDFPATIQLDQIIGTDGDGVRIQGANWARLGSAIAPAGDVNGDGIPDLLLGSPKEFDEYYEGYQGRTYVIFGRDTASDGEFPAQLDTAALDPADGFSIYFDLYDSPAFDLRLGIAVASADINDDGFADLFAGGTTDEVYVVYGGPDVGASGRVDLDDLDGEIGFTVSGDEEETDQHDSDSTGIALAFAGDINHDGVDDVIIGAPAAEPDGAEPNVFSAAGEAYVVFGRSGQRSEAETDGQNTAPSLETPGFDLASLDGTNGFVVVGDSERIGQAVASAGDLNHDGIDDIVTVARNGAQDAGIIYVVFGRDATTRAPFPPTLNVASINGDNGFLIVGANPGTRAGMAVTSADLNADGIDDLIIGDHAASPSGLQFAGEAYVVFGRDTALSGDFPLVFELSTIDGTNGLVIQGVDDGDRVGWDLANAGDANLDGIDDLIVLASGSGEAHVVFGKDTAADGPLPATLPVSTLDGTNGFTLLGAFNSVSGAGDVNADGIDDVIAGSRVTVDGLLSAGQSYVFFGRDTAADGPFPATIDLTALTGTDGFILSGTRFAGYVGTAVSSAGDINDDGARDVLIGAPWTGGDKQEYRIGRAYVVYGKDTGAEGGFPPEILLSDIDGSNGFQLLGHKPRDYAGADVTDVGDVNADGFDDVFIGANRAEPLRTDDTGQAYVLFGRNAAAEGQFPAAAQLKTLDATQGFFISGLNEDDRIAAKIARAGDVNNDDIDDLIIGAERVGEFGATYVVFGDPDLPFTPLPFSIADLNADGAVNVLDFAILAGAFGAAQGDPTFVPAADLNADAAIDVLDFALFASDFGRTP